MIEGLVVSELDCCIPSQRLKGLARSNIKPSPTTHHFLLTTEDLVVSEGVLLYPKSTFERFGKVKHEAKPQLSNPA